MASNARSNHILYLANGDLPRVVLYLLPTLMNIRNFIAVTMALAALTPVSHANSPSTIARQFYDANPACSIASVINIEQLSNTLVVTLDVEKATALALQNTETAHRDAWLNLHCPAETNKLWGLLGKSGEVKIVVNPDSNRLTLECSEYSQRIKKRSVNRKSNVRERINSLLSKLRSKK